jgi:hypothetical protein
MATCVPLKPFRCWQYRKEQYLNGEQVPEWAQQHIRWLPDDGWWLVDVYVVGEFRYRWYTPAEFAERFRVEPTNHPCPHEWLLSVDCPLCEAERFKVTE